MGKKKVKKIITENIIVNIYKLDDDGCEALIDSIKHLKKDIRQEVANIMEKAECSKQDALEYVVTNNIYLWAKVYLDWESRDYQTPILNEIRNNNRVVLRLGRRLGKTDMMCVAILWYACTQANKGENNQYDILILTPYETQIDLIFDRLSQLIQTSPLVQGMIDREIYHRIDLINGTFIKGLTAGANSGNGAASTRGVRCDILIYDEVDYIGSAQITNTLNIANEDPKRIKIIAATTPSGRHEEFYKWCINSSKSLKVTESDIDNFTFSGYVVTTSEERGVKGNGWVECYAPSVVNKKLLEINPLTGQTFLQDLKDELSELRYDQEVMARFGDQTMGVYKKSLIEAAIQRGVNCGLKYFNEMSKEEQDLFLNNKTGPRILAVDWDKVQTGTTIMAIELDKNHINEKKECEPIFKIFLNELIPSSKFTYTTAVNRIIELNDIFNFDWIAIDRGYGEVQLELLHKYGMANPETELHEKTVGYQFKQNIVVRDPFTMKKDEKPMKPFMVNNSVITFEKFKIALNPRDKVLREQIEGYRVERISQNGMPIFSSENEHGVDTMNLALLIFAQKYEEMFRNIINTKIISIGELKRYKENKLFGTNKSQLINPKDCNVKYTIQDERKTKELEIIDRTSCLQDTGTDGNVHSKQTFRSINRKIARYRRSNF